MLFYSESFPIRDIAFYHKSPERRARMRENRAVVTPKMKPLVFDCPHCGHTVKVPDPSLLYENSREMTFAELREDIEKRGIVDPVLCVDLGYEVRIETGEQRLLIANDLSIPTLRAFIRSRANFANQHVDARIGSREEVEAKFVDTGCPTCAQILKYIDRGVIRL